MINNETYYLNIYKRKSFHLFRDTLTVSEKDLMELNDFIKEVKPLEKDIQYKIKVVKESDTTCHRGAEYCVLFYSEAKGDYLRNIGYIGEQIDLYLTSKNIGTLWFGIGKPKIKNDTNLEYVIMLAFSKVKFDTFRKNMFKSKRKDLSEVWSGEYLPFSDVIRFAPSACNSQPWFVSREDDILVYRYKEPGKRGIMPKDKVTFYNRIDSGIFLFFFDVLLTYYQYDYTKVLFHDDGDSSREKTLIAKIKIDMEHKNKKSN